MGSVMVCILFLDVEYVGWLIWLLNVVMFVVLMMMLCFFFRRLFLVIRVVVCEIMLNVLMRLICMMCLKLVSMVGLLL